jgi:hypothetical protein
MNRISRPGPVALAFAKAALLVVLTVAPSGCGGDGSVSKAAASMGLAEVPTLPPEVVDILCDVSIESPCTATTLAEQLDRVLPYAAARPGTHIRIWRGGKDVSDVILEAETVSPAPAKRKKAQKGADTKWIAEARRFLLKAAEPMLNGPRVMRSPLMEATTKIAMADVPGITQRTQILISDGLQVSTYADFECAELAPIDTFCARLHAEHVLVPGVLKDTKVYLAFTDMSHAARNRCRSTIFRLSAITDTWRQVLREAGATETVITNGVAPIGERPSE